jgi:hypothetical protein
MAANKALYVAGGSDLFEPTYTKRGQAAHYFGVIDRFREPIHSGRKAEALLAEYGLTRGRAIIGTYDAVRRQAAARAIDARWWLVDPFGRPLTMEQVAVNCLVLWRLPPTADAIAELVEDLEALASPQHRWLIWADYRPVEKQLTVPLPLTDESELGPDRVETEAEPGPHADPPTDNRQKQDRQTATVNPDNPPTPLAETPDSDAAERERGEEIQGRESAALPALPRTIAPDGHPPTAVGLLRMLGFDAVAAMQVAADALDAVGPGEDVELILDAAEGAEIMQRAGELKRSVAAYVRGFVRDGGWKLPAELDRRRRRPWRHLALEECRAPPM